MKLNRFAFTTTVLAFGLSLQALAATVAISFSDPAVTLGNDVNVTMKAVSTDGKLSRADITLAYDTSHLEFISGTDAEGGAGTIRVHGATNGGGTGTLEYNLKFKTLAAGTGAVAIAAQEVYDLDETIAEITHNGTSAVTINPAEGSSRDAALQALVASPGTLNPAFTPDSLNYEINVGTDVETLAVNAVPADSHAKVSIEGNDKLNMGENLVKITVSAQDGSTTVYNIKVVKNESGATMANATILPVNEGVKLSSKEKTISIMNPGGDIEIPDSFAESTIDIDGHQVKGWVWKDDADHKYCIVYGMNDSGELNFYRYDLSEKTLQRYFEDPVGVQLKADAENYPKVVERYDHLVSQYNRMFILCCVLGAMVILLIILLLILLLTRKSRTDHSAKKQEVIPKTPALNDRTRESIIEEEISRKVQTRKSEPVEEPEEKVDLEFTKVIDKNAEAVPESTVSMDETRVISVSDTKLDGIELEDLDEDETAAPEAVPMQETEAAPVKEASAAEETEVKNEAPSGETMVIPQIRYEMRSGDDAPDSIGLDVEDL